MGQHKTPRRCRCSATCPTAKEALTLGWKGDRAGWWMCPPCIEAARRPQPLRPLTFSPLNRVLFLLGGA